MYSEKQFLQKFKGDQTMSYAEFMESAKVRTPKRTLKLKDYLHDKKVTTEQIKHLYDAIQNSDEYLKSFYKTSLKPYDNEIKNKPMEEFNNNSKVQYKNIIRNMFYKDIMENTQPGHKGIVSYGTMVNDLFNNLIIDYKLLTPSALHYIKAGRIGSVFSSYYFRASIMNPYLVFSLQESLLKGTKIFTPTLGWGSYNYGFLESKSVTEYVGTDVIPNVCKKVKSFANQLYPYKKTKIYCEPSENLYHDKTFMAKYSGYFDTVFFSPPYYDLEMYSGAKQSTNKYKTYEEWLEKYWTPTIMMCNKILKKGGKMCYIISNYTKGKTTVNLVEDLTNITKKHFTLTHKIPMKNKSVYVNKTGNQEQIIIFRK